MRGYGNQGEVVLGPEFRNLIASSRFVFSDIFPDEQVEIPTTYPMQFTRLCELLRTHVTTRAH
jgi:hypothetical protein